MHIILQCQTFTVLQALCSELHVHFFTYSSEQLYEIQLIPVFQVRKVKPREAQWFVQDHAAS